MWENNKITLVLSDPIPEDEDFVSLPDALLYQMEQQHHFC